MRIDIYHHTVREPGLDALSRKLDRLITQGDLIMSTLAELNTKLTDLTTAITEERTEVQGMLTGLRTQVQTLQDQIAGGSVAAACSGAGDADRTRHLSAGSHRAARRSRHSAAAAARGDASAGRGWADLAREAGLDAGSREK